MALGSKDAAAKAGTAAAASDERLKSDIVRVGTHKLGIGIYKYKIFDREEIGVIAQELLPILPEAVIMHPSGYYMVDYSKVWC